MTSISYTQARQLSHCDVGSSHFDSLVVDQFFPLLPVEEVEGDCVRYPLISEADKPATINYVSSGGAISTNPVAYGATGEYALKRIVARIVVNGDIAENVSQVHSVAQDQALAMATLITEKVSSELWSEAPGADAPSGMAVFSAQNPGGMSVPSLGAGTAMTIEDLELLRDKVSPWSAATPLYYVLPPKLHRQLHQRAREMGSPLDYYESPAVGQVLPHLDGIPVLACGQISLNEGGAGRTSAYLVRCGRGEGDPAKIAGVTRVHPKGHRDIEVGPLRAIDGTADEFDLEIAWNIAFANYSRSSVARLREIAP